MRTPEYVAWVNMIARCENPGTTGFHRWGGRGVRVCAKWRKSFRAFLAYVGRRPSAAHSLDRFPNKNGHYEPGNVRWATKREQARNRRGNRIVVAFGEALCVAAWAERTGFPEHVIAKRLAAGWRPADALSKPLRPARFMFRGRTLTAVEICRRTGVSSSAFWRRIRETGDADTTVTAWRGNRRGKNQARHKHGE